MLTDAFINCNAGLPIRYCFDGKLFNLKRSQAKPKVQTGVLDKLLYAHEMVEDAKQRQKWSEFHKHIDLLISTKILWLYTSQHTESRAMGIESEVRTPYQFKSPLLIPNFSVSFCSVFCVVGVGFFAEIYLICTCTYII